MPALPTPAKATVERFAASMDLTAYEAEDFSYSFDFENSGRLSIIATDMSIIVTLTRRILLDDLRGYAPLAAIGGYNQMSDSLLHVGLSKANQPVLARRFSIQEFTFPMLQVTFETMVKQFQGAGL